WLKILDGTDYSKQRAVKYYSEASRISTSVSMMYFPEQNCPDEAEKYLKKAIGLAEKIEALNGPTENHWVYFNNLGTHYYETYRPKEALSVLLNGLQYAKNDNARTVLFHNISLCYADLGDIKAAVEYLIRSICLH
ncbi:hypothetical protein E3E34_11470, partial [Thermococcus sp. GR4]|nr:hypothetical protein [Thermococcus sp. GR4]